jgi:hypothetical protein
MPPPPPPTLCTRNRVIVYGQMTLVQTVRETIQIFRMKMLQRAPYRRRIVPTNGEVWSLESCYYLDWEFRQVLTEAVKVVVSWIWRKNWQFYSGLSPETRHALQLGNYWLDKPMWYNVSELPYAATVRSVLHSEKLCNFSLPKIGITAETSDFVTSRRDEIAAIRMGYCWYFVS